MEVWPIRLQLMRKVAGMKQSALADKLGVDQTTVSKWERGAATPNSSIQTKAERILLDACKNAPGFEYKKDGHIRNLSFDEAAAKRGTKPETSDLWVLTWCIVRFELDRPGCNCPAIAEALEAVLV